MEQRMISTASDAGAAPRQAMEATSRSGVASLAAVMLTPELDGW